MFDFLDPFCQRLARSMVDQMTDEQRAELSKPGALSPGSVGEVFLQQNFDIGKAPNRIPSGVPNTDSDRRSVFVGTHPISGGEGYRWSEVQKAELEKSAPGSSERYPDPTFHWAVCVGNFYHELNADWKLTNVYQNGVTGNKENPGKYVWKMFEVGTTRYNDEAIRLAGEKAMAERMNGETYNLINNNCQNFVVQLLTLICEPGFKSVIPIQMIVDYGKIETFAMGAPVVQGSTGAEAAKALMAKETPLVYAGGH